MTPPPAAEENDYYTISESPPPYYSTPNEPRPSIQEPYLALLPGPAEPAICSKLW